MTLSHVFIFVHLGSCLPVHIPSPNQDGPAAIDDEAAVVHLLDELGYPILYGPPPSTPPLPKSVDGSPSDTTSAQEGAVPLSTTTTSSVRHQLTSPVALSEGTAAAMEGIRQQWAARLDVSRQEVSAALALHTGTPPAAALVCYAYAASEH